MEVLKNKIVLPHNPAIPLLSMETKEMKTDLEETYTPSCLSLVIATIWMQQWMNG